MGGAFAPTQNAASASFSWWGWNKATQGTASGGALSGWQPLCSANSAEFLGSDEAWVLQCHGDGQCQALHASSLPNASLSCALGFGGVYWLSLPSGQPRGPRGGVEGQCQSRRPGPWLLMCRGPCGLRPRLPPSPAQASGLPPVSGGDGSISVTVELEDLRQGPE